ncbi:DUF3971 domain-containing protein [Vibrio sagamiensis NBRC 104589]|uniref:DUF3971 domain-containing protein n=1 Tax=Vibrio sagamiensis NBRC 104589 TaxID=1219064 RepID=A0A511QFH7_9VIBR|nr:DUF3971 domain-containing protein [Vibrio sagamiensis NBRC 104589]
MVLLALFATALRVALPHLNSFQNEIVAWVKQDTGFDFSVNHMIGTWRNSHPSLELQGLKANLPQEQPVGFTVDKIAIEFDLIRSILQLNPVISDLNINGLTLDVRSLELFSKAKNVSQTDPQTNSESSSQQHALLAKLDALLLHQLQDFTINQSQIWYRSISQETRRLDIEQLHWRNRGQSHQVEGSVSIIEPSLNSLLVNANFKDYGSLRDISGDIFVSVQNVSIGPWLTQYMQEESGIKSGEVSLNSWLTLERGHPADAYVEVQPSKLIWEEKGCHELSIQSGIFKLSPHQDGWKAQANSLQVSTDDVAWPNLDITLNAQPLGWLLNISQLDIATLKPLAKLAPSSEFSTDTLEHLSPKGRLEDVRISIKKGLDSLLYSAKLSDFSLSQWKAIPNFNQVNVTLSGDLKQARMKLTVMDDIFSFGEWLQAPLDIKQSEIDLVWQQDDNGWRIWSDKTTMATRDIQVLGAFMLDFPKGQSPFLSLYAEADLYNAGEVWRYLPLPALGQNLTNYLSTAIQGGKVDTAKLLWYGELERFPYKANDGIFQAWLGLENATFSFDTSWPSITDLQLDLHFQNESMYLESNAAKLKGIKAQKITGSIDSLATSGGIFIEATAQAPASEVRDYMMATPLVDSVGAALTALKISGSVSSSFKLTVPFDSNNEVRAWGYADLNSSRVKINAPPMTLENTTGRIQFDNDVVTGKGIKASLLSQPLVLNFDGAAQHKGYQVAIQSHGEWQVEPLKSYLGEQWLEPLSGKAPWQMSIDLQLGDIDFNYQVDLIAQLDRLASQYPYPLTKPTGTAGQAKLKASGDQASITAQLQLPEAKYQAEIDISHEAPVLNATNLVIGQGGFKVNPMTGHSVSVNLDKLDFNKWQPFLQDITSVTKAEKVDVKAEPSPLIIPLPTQFSMDVDVLRLGEIELNDIALDARNQNNIWQVAVDSQETKGKASYDLPNHSLSVALEQLHLYIPSFDDKKIKRNSLLVREDLSAPLISKFERKFYQEMPNLTLSVEDFWLQGYKVGQVNIALARQADRLEWQQMSFASGQSHVDIKGWWQLSETQSHSYFNLAFKGENNSDLMERFGITSGIQQAPFEIKAKVDWDGAPWSMKTQTLQGEVTTEFGKGVISQVSGAARLLGLFSLDSIIRKMQLDFTDVFDKGLAFNSIKGSGKIQEGVFVTNDIEMDALAGEMTIRGIADMNTRLVDAEVSFIPDITSGIPMLTAFAVAPQTALYVLAISTVISPVVEVFTQVNYSVEGPLDSPTVKEISRSKGQYTLPEQLRENAK